MREGPLKLAWTFAKTFNTIWQGGEGYLCGQQSREVADPSQVMFSVDSLQGVPSVDVVYIASTEELLSKEFPLKGTLKTRKTKPY